MSSSKKSTAPKAKPTTAPASAPGRKPTSGPFAGGFWMQHRWPALVLLILPMILYFQSMGFGYVLDDKIVLSENKFVQQGSKGIKDIFATESFTGFLGEQKDLVVGARYRPLSIATFAIEHQLFGNKPGLSHGINILLYALTAMLLYRLFFLLVPPPKDATWFFTVPFVGALLFALHPVHTEVVANIKGRDEILALLFALASTYAVLRYSATQSIMWLIGAPALFLLALLAKENALAFAAVAPLAILLFQPDADVKKLGVGSALMLAPAVVFVLIRASVIGYLLSSGKEVTDLMNNPFVEATQGQKYATITMTLGWYLKLLVYPHPLTHDYYPYHVPLVEWSDWRAWGSLVLVAGLLGYAGFIWRRSKVMAFSIFYFFITLAIVSNLVFPVGTFMNERFIYMPSVGFCLLVAYLLVQKLPEWLSVKTGQMVAYGVLGVMGLGFAVRTVTRVPAWENTASLEAASIQVSYNSARSNQYYAYSLYEKALQEKDPVKQKALYDEAWPYVNKALEIYPAYYDAHTCRDGIAAAYYQQDGDISKLLPYFENTLRTKPTDFVDQYLEYLSKRGQHLPELTEFFHRIGFDYFWSEKRDGVRAKKYLQMGLRLAPGDTRLAIDLAAVK